MTKQKKQLIALVILAAGFWVTYQYFGHSGNGASDAVLVQASTVTQTSLPVETHAIGTLVAKSVEITPETAGHVDKILFEDGATVKQGDILIQLNDAVTKAQLESAKAALTFSERSYNRMLSLGKTGVVSKQALDQAEADFKQKKADAEEKEVMLSQTKLTAPFDGTVGRSKVNPGDYVTVGQGIVTVTNTKHLHIEYSVPEKFYPLLKAQQDVAITSATYPGKTFSGKLTFIAPTINVDNRSVSVYAEIPNESNTLASGMFVDITQSLNSQEQALVIPSRSLVPSFNGEQVYKVVNGKVSATPVVIGKRINDSVQIVDGLKPGDVVITDGQIKVQNGSRVKIKA